MKFKPLFICLFVLITWASFADKKYTFTEDWFSYKTVHLEKLLAGYKGKKNVRMLELGPYEGRSTFWFLDNVLTDQSSQIIAVDSYIQDCEGYRSALELFKKNRKISKRPSSIKLYTEPSKKFLKRYNDKFDIVFIDASPVAKDRLLDAMLSWDLLKYGGLLIIDDYDRSQKMPLEFRPSLAIDSFITLFRNEAEIVMRKSFYAFRKIKLNCMNKTKREKKFCNSSLCSRIDNVEFLLKDGKELFFRDDKKSCSLTNSQANEFIGFLKKRKYATSKLPKELRPKFRKYIESTCKLK